MIQFFNSMFSILAAMLESPVLKWLIISSLWWAVAATVISVWFAVRRPKSSAVCHAITASAIIACSLISFLPQWGSGFVSPPTTFESRPQVLTPLQIPHSDRTANLPQSELPLPPNHVADMGETATETSAIHGASLSHQDSTTGYTLPTDSIADDADRLPSTAGNSAATASTTNDSITWQQVVIRSLLTIWCLGVGLFVFRFMLAVRVMMRWRREVLPLGNDELKLLEACKRDLEIHRRIATGTHNEASVPMVLCGITPLIVTPADWNSWDANSRRAAWRHELSHVRRGDDWWRVLSEVLRMVWWFHPGVHWLLLQREYEAELLSDEAAISAGCPPRLMAELLLDACRRPKQKQPKLVVPAAQFISARTLKQRIERLINQDSDESNYKPLPAPKYLKWFALLAICLVTLLGSMRVMVLAGTEAALMTDNTRLEAGNTTEQDADRADSGASQTANGSRAGYPRMIQGKITDAEGKPVAEALIEWAPDYPPDAPRESVRSLADGTYRLEVQKAGRKFVLGVSAVGSAPAIVRGLLPGPTTKPTELDVKLLAETQMRIEIVDEAKQPIPNLEVLPMTPQQGFNSSFSMVEQPKRFPGHDRPTACDANGVCQLRQLLAAPEPLLEADANDTAAQTEWKQRTNQGGWLSLRITHDGNTVHEHAISRQQFFDSKGSVQIVVPDSRNPLKEGLKNGTIFGQVVDALGMPVSQYLVTLRYRPEPKSVTDTQGQFEWGNDLDPGREYEVRIFAKGFAPQVARITPRETERSKPRRIELKPNPSTEFELYDPETSMPLPNVTVVAGLSEDNAWNYVEWNDLGSYADGHHGLKDVVRITTDAEGRFSLPEGETAATLLILTPGYARKIVTPQQRPGRDKRTIVAIPLTRSASIRGIMAKDSRLSRTASGVSLNAASVNGFEQMFHGLTLDANGECLIESLAAGEYYISLNHSDGNMSTACWYKKIKLAAGESKIVQLGEMTGNLTLRGKTAPFTDVSLTRKPSANDPQDTESLLGVATISDVEGNFEINQLEVGKYAIELGRLQSVGGGFLLAGIGPAEIELSQDTYVDFTTGEVRALTPSGHDEP